MPLIESVIPAVTTLPVPARLASQSAIRILLVLIYLLGGPFVILSQRYLVTMPFDSVVICFYRALAGCLSLAALACLADRQGLRDFLVRRGDFGLVAMTGLLLGAGSLLVLEGIRYAGALSASLFGILGMALLTPISLALFRDEQPKRSSWLIAGVLLASIGAAGYAWAAGGETEIGARFSYGVALLAVATLISCMHIPLSKRAVVRSSPLAVAATMQAVAMVSFLAAGIIRGVHPTPFDIGLEPMLWMFLSGSVGMLIGVGLSMVILKRIGVVRRQVLHLCTPPLVGVFAYLLFNEGISPVQSLYIVILLAGCGCVAGAGTRSARVTIDDGWTDQSLRVGGRSPAESGCRAALTGEGL